MIGNYRRVSPSQLAALCDDPESIRDFLYPPADNDPPGAFDVDRAWHAIHFLLNGDAWGGEPPLGNAVLGGRPLGDIDVGYGPARYLTADEVAETADALEQVSSDKLLARFDVELLNGVDIYPTSWNGDDREHEFVRENYQRLVRFFRATADAGDALLIFLN